MNKENIIYKLADVKDIPVLVENRIKFLLEIQGQKSENEIETLRQELTLYNERAIPSGEFIAFIAEYENHAIAFSGLVIQAIPPSFTIINGKIGYVLNMYTLPEYRGNGICPKLMDLIVEKGKELGLFKLYLNATKDGYQVYVNKGFKSPTWAELEMKF